jgi:hypothetical protein
LENPFSDLLEMLGNSGCFLGPIVKVCQSGFGIFGYAMTMGWTRKDQAFWAVFRHEDYYCIILSQCHLNTRFDFYYRYGFHASLEHPAHWSSWAITILTDFDSNEKPPAPEHRERPMLVS